MTKRLKNSFGAAFKGLKETIIHEKSFKIMLVIAALVVIAMFYFHVSRLEKIALLAAIFLVLILELINSTIERIMNFVQPQKEEQVRIIKDLMAAIILLASCGAVIIGLLVFWNYLFK